MRRSCEIEVSSAERSRSVSASSARGRHPRPELTRSIASAAWSASASSSRCWSGVSSGPGSSRSMPTTPTAPRPVRIGRNSRLAPGSVSAPRPAGAVLLPAPFRRGEIGVVQRVLGRIAGAHRDRARPRAAAGRRAPSASARSGSAVAHSRSSSVDDAGELAAELIELLGRPRALPRRDRLARARARSDCWRSPRRRRKKNSATTFSGSAMVKV